MSGISVEVRDVGGTAGHRVVEVEGFVDASNTGRLEESLDEEIGRGTSHVVVDLTEVDYVSSAGWGVFISSARRLRDRGGDLCLVGMQKEVAEVFELLEFHTILSAFSSLEDALVPGT